MRRSTRLLTVQPNAMIRAVFEVAHASRVLGSGQPVFIVARVAEALVVMLIIFGEIQIVLNERSADVRVVTHAVAVDDGTP